MRRACRWLGMEGGVFDQGDDESNAATWREDAFGIKPSPAVTDACVRRMLGELYYTGQNPFFPEWRQRLPAGCEASWQRGTWSPLRDGRDRLSEIYSEVYAERDKARGPVNQPPVADS